MYAAHAQVRTWHQAGVLGRELIKIGRQFGFDGPLIVAKTHRDDQYDLHWRAFAHSLQASL
jgi:hypothetical protein